MKSKICIIIMALLVAPIIIAQTTDYKSYIKKAQFREAINCIQSQERTKESIADEIYCYKALGDHYKAIRLLEELRAEYPNDVMAQVELADLYAETLNYSKSVECLDRLLEKDSENSYFMLQKSNVLFQAEKYSSALRLYKEINDKEESNFSLRRMALCYENMQLQDSAIAYYKRAYASDSLDWISVANLMKNYIKSEDFDLALSLSDTFLMRDSTNSEILKLDAYSTYRLDRYDESVKKFNVCLARGDSSLIVNRSLGLSYFGLGDDSTTLKYLDLAYAQDSTNNNVLYVLGIVNQDLNRHDVAIVHFEKLLERTLPNKDVLHQYHKELAKSYYHEDEFDKAIDFYQRALSYTTSAQKMYPIYGSMANIYEYSLMDDAKAKKCYEEYINNLELYKAKLLENTDGAMDDIDKINTVIEKCKSHIVYLGEPLESINR